MKMFPVPSRPVPILIGGHSKPALTRAARLGDGWIAANTDFETLKSLLRQLHELRRAHGTDGRKDFEIHGFDVAAQTPSDYQRLAELGVTDACVAPWGFDPSTPLPAQLDGMRRFGDTIISRM